MEKFDVLQRSPLFHTLSASEVELAAEMSRPRKFAAGEAIFEQGDLGDAIFVIADGEVEVLCKNDDGELRALETFGPPQFFGEMSLIDKAERSATVRAKTDCVLLELTAENFAAFRKHYRDGFTFVVMNIARALSARLRETNARLTVRL
ncbi:MAG: Crp/Fnr family transcriptional regulator [Myxococcales bacterium]|jgi:CRP/FNR family cyclic AMP-dependent transcriptional regulator